MTLEEAILKIEGHESFEFIMSMMKQYKETHVSDLSNMANAENPQLLAYLAGGISAIGLVLDQINECRSERPN